MPEFHAYPAPAKLNLFLHVTGRRADGYHLLQTVFRFIDYGDTLAFAIDDSGSITQLTPLAGVPAEQDLVVRAARLLQQHSDCRLGAQIKLEKRLPMGGGLGGGSSDAATALLALNRLWGLQLPRVELQQLALRLGADVPVFVFGRNAFAEGIGEALQAVELPAAWYLVIHPGVHVPTAEIFSSERLTRNSEPIIMATFPAALTGGRLKNDLQPVACEKYPVIQEALDWLKPYSPAMMTGSGACVFAEFDSHLKAEAALRQMPATYSGFVAQGLNQHPLLSLAS